MNWRKWNRWLHRETGFLFFGMALVYGISGIALNHGAARHWNADIISRSESYYLPGPLHKDAVGRTEVEEILEITGERHSFKQYFFPDSLHLMIYLKGGHIEVDLAAGEALVTKVRHRPFFREVNYLHYNKPKRLWTWFSDLFAFSLVLLAGTGIYMVRGKKGISGTGGILLAIGVFVPLLFLVINLWL
ncbi:MAG: PepSY-associated TM helix domain-containing protein [Bacteroidota bacterium]